MTVCKSSVTRTAGHSCEMGQQRAGVITAETQTRWRLLRWSNPKDGAMQRYLYVHMCAHTSFFFQYIHIYNTRIIRRAFMRYSCQEKGVTLELFPRIPEQTSSQLVREGEGWAEKGFVSSLGMHAAHTLPG